MFTDYFLKGLGFTLGVATGIFFLLILIVGTR